jgi:hypothetical protein
LQGDVMTMDAVSPFIPLSFVCHEAAHTDASGRTACGVLAERLLKSEGSLIGHIVAYSMGKTAGWTAERLEAIRAQLDAAYKALAREGELTPSLGCKWLDRLPRWADDYANHGEKGWIARLIESQKGMHGTATKP